MWLRPLFAEVMLLIKIDWKIDLILFISIDSNSEFRMFQSRILLVSYQDSQHIYNFVNMECIKDIFMDCAVFVENALSHIFNTSRR